jgi:hypothetical protein
MNRTFFTGIFALGLAAVVWVGFGFVGSSPLALLMTAVIAGVYGTGGLRAAPLPGSHGLAGDGAGQASRSP